MEISLNFFIRLFSLVLICELANAFLGSLVGDAIAMPALVLQSECIG